MHGVPREITEAAHIDGANHLAIYASIIMPMTKTAIATLVVINGMYVWNDFFLPFMFLTRGNLRTLPQNLVLFQSNVVHTSWPEICANVVYTVAPILIIYLFLQKYIIAGVAEGAVKG